MGSAGDKNPCFENLGETENQGKEGQGSASVTSQSQHRASQIMTRCRKTTRKSFQQSIFVDLCCWAAGFSC